MFKYQYFKRSIRGASQKCRHEKRKDIRMDSSIGEGLSLEGGMPPSPEGRKMMQMASTFAEDAGVPVYEQGPIAGVGGIVFGKRSLPQGFKVRHGIGEPKAQHQPRCLMSERIKNSSEGTRWKWVSLRKASF